MKIALAAALAVLFFASPTRADNISTPNGVLVIPDGSTVTSEFIVPCCAFGPSNAYGVDFQFQDGTGIAYGESNDGDVGTLTFTIPVSALSVTWIATGPASLGISGGTYANGGYISTDCQCTTGPVVETFSGSIVSLAWVNYYGYSGIESMTYTEDTPVNTPELSTWSGLAAGMMLVFVLVHKERSVNRGRNR
jgi:hypothetical protein